MNKNMKRLIRAVEMGGDAFPPACRCGCGEPVRYRMKGPQVYVNRAHQGWDKDMKAMSVQAHTKATDSIPIEKFRGAVLQMKDRKGWSIAEMAQLAGQQPGWLHTYLYDKRLKSIGRDVATSFFRRLSGLGSEATVYEQRTARAHINRVSATIGQMNLDAPKPKVELWDWAPSHPNKKKSVSVV